MYRTFHNYTNFLHNIDICFLNFFAQAPFSFNLVKPVIYINVYCVSSQEVGVVEERIPVNSCKDKTSKCSTMGEQPGRLEAGEGDALLGAE